MEIYHLVATADDNVIGKNNKLPWHFSEDLKRFKKLTLGNTILMGRKTFESIGAKPLPGRENFVLSRTKRTPPPLLPPQVGEDKGGGIKFFTSFEEALDNVQTEKVFVIGGSEIFKQTLGQVDGIYLTRIKGIYEGDAFYPEIPSYFQEETRETSVENPNLEFIFCRNTKKKK